jgi:putative transposase
MIDAAKKLSADVGTAEACRALSVSRATVYRRRNPTEKSETTQRKPQPRELKSEERHVVIDVLHSPQFVDKAPAQVYTSLLDQGIYYCSTRTMYRILHDNKEVRERRNQLRRPNYKKPELLATGPNQVWSWDITKLRGPKKGTFFYLYVIIDIYSRYTVGWMLASRESAENAKLLIDETAARQQIDPGQLTIHSDRGSPMISTGVNNLMIKLGVTKSLNRPYVSNDNPYSESQFKTLKYQPEYPDRFGCHEDAHGYCTSFFEWYNNDHYHSGIGMFTPAMVHYGGALELLKKRQETLDMALAAHPERFVRKRPEPQPLPEAAWINRPEKNKDVSSAKRLVLPSDIEKGLPVAKDEKPSEPLAHCRPGYPSPSCVSTELGPVSPGSEMVQKMSGPE